MKQIIILAVLVLTGAVAHGGEPEGLYYGDGLELWFEGDTWIIFLGYDSMGEAMLDYGYWEEKTEDSYYLRYDDGFVAYIFETNHEFSYLKPGDPYLLLGLADEDDVWGLERIE